jgi:hypothetical protein
MPGCKGCPGDRSESLDNWVPSAIDAEGFCENNTRKINFPTNKKNKHNKQKAIHKSTQNLELCLVVTKFNQL